MPVAVMLINKKYTKQDQKNRRNVMRKIFKGSGELISEKAKDYPDCYCT